MAGGRRRGILGRLLQRVRNVFRTPIAGQREQPPPPRPRPTAPPPSRIPVFTQPEPVPFSDVTPPTEGAFGFPVEGEQYDPTEPEFYNVHTEWPYYGAYPPSGTVPIIGDETYWAPADWWYDLVATNDVATLEGLYGVGNIGIIHQLIDRGLWDNSLGSMDWQRFREEYTRQFGIMGVASRYSPTYGR